jgi:hypothetical protein
MGIAVKAKQKSTESACDPVLLETALAVTELCFSRFSLGLFLRQGTLELLGLLQLGAKLVDRHLLDDSLVHAQCDQASALNQATAALGSASLAGTDLVFVTEGTGCHCVISRIYGVFESEEDK